MLQKQANLIINGKNISCLTLAAFFYLTFNDLANKKKTKRKEKKLFNKVRSYKIIKAP